ncbi:MAG: hypothetical protein ACOYXC_21595 [Candidatus Rifleibacteriota bacterium]
MIKENIALKDTAKGKSAFLIATGPSLKLENLKLLEGEHCYSISNFYLHADVKTVSPRIHFFAPYHEPMVFENYIDWMKQADACLPSSTEICMGHTTHKMVEDFNLFPNRKIHYVFLDNFASASKDITQPLLAPQTGPIMAIPFLLYMGYSKIYLLGCDQTVLRDYRKNITNFYDPHKDIRKFATSIDAWPGIIESHICSLNACQQYKMYNDLAKNNGVKIINLSKDSWLDFFETEILENCTSKSVDL